MKPSAENPRRAAPASLGGHSPGSFAMYHTIIPAAGGAVLLPFDISLSQTAIDARGANEGSFKRFLRAGKGGGAPSFKEDENSL